MDATIDNLAAELEAPAAVGDLDGLRTRLETLRGLAVERRAAADAERAAAKLVALDARNAMIEAAEKIAATDPERMQWRPAGEQLRVLLDQWKDAQRRGPRLDRGSEDALWKRFSHARSTFDRERRRWFSELEKSNTTARSQKEQLVAERRGPRDEHRLGRHISRLPGPDGATGRTPVGPAARTTTRSGRDSALHRMPSSQRATRSTSRPMRNSLRTSR